MPRRSGLETANFHLTAGAARPAPPASARRAARIGPRERRRTACQRGRVCFGRSTWLLGLLWLGSATADGHPRAIGYVSRLPIPALHAIDAFLKAAG